MTTRTHTKNATFNPADYVLLAHIDAGTDEDPGAEDWEDPRHPIRETWSPDINELRCAHCGKHGSQIRYSVLFLHVPTNEPVWFGHVCAIEANLAGVDALFAKRAKEAAERRIIKARAWYWAEANLDVTEWMHANKERNHFPESLLASLLRNGELTEKQTAAARKWIATAKTREEERARKAAQEAETKPEAGPFPTGRVQVIGTVLNVRLGEMPTYRVGFAEPDKWLVEMDDGNRVWGSIPQSAFKVEVLDPYRAEGDETSTVEMYARDINALRGARVSFKATVERSDKDEHFGYYKRPSKCEVKIAEGVEE